MSEGQQNDDHRRSPDADKRTAISVLVIFVLLLIIFPLLISIGKRNERNEQSYTSPKSSSKLKFD